jgi:hypothetical protein
MYVYIHWFGLRRDQNIAMGAFSYGVISFREGYQSRFRAFVSFTICSSVIGSQREEFSIFYV